MWARVRAVILSDPFPFIKPQPSLFSAVSSFLCDLCVKSLTRPLLL